MKYIRLPILVLFFASCIKEKIQEPIPEIVVPYSEAGYRITCTLNWQLPQFTVPLGAHVTALVGMVHSKDTVLWNTEKRASKGLEEVAEDGNATSINLELDDIISKGRAISKFLIAPPAITGTIETMLNFNTNFTCFSFVSMMAPSPDWFMGIHDLNLFKNNKWNKDTTIHIFLYDAGTEEGDIFGYDNPSSNPAQNISLLQPAKATVLANGNTSFKPIGLIHFEKIN